MTALLVAAEHGNIDVAKLLIARGADVSARSRDGSNVVLVACGGGQLATLRWLAEELQVSLDCSDKNQNRAVHCAAVSGSVETVKYLLQALPRDINITNGNGHTPIEVCAFKGAVECVRYLLSQGCIVSNIDPRGNTTAHLAAAGENPECFRLILHAGALHSHLNNDGISPLEVAKNRSPALVRVYNEFLLYHAAKTGDLAAIRHQHEKLGVSLTVTDPISGRTALDVAKEPSVRAYIEQRLLRKLRNDGGNGEEPLSIDAFQIGLLVLVAVSWMLARK